MQKNVFWRRLIASGLALALVASLPAASYARDGKKHFKNGVKYEQNKQWDKAAEQYAIAVAEDSSNIEYLMRYQRSLVNAGIMLSERGDTFADQKDYNSAYQAYRQAFSFDPTNELAFIKMRRMLEVQGLPLDNLPGKADHGPSFKPSKKNGAAILKTSTSAEAMSGQGAGPRIVPAYLKPQNIKYRPGTSIQTAVEQLAQSMNLNVMFDSAVLNFIKNPNQNFSVDLQNVTPPKALEMILQANNLMYSQLDRRTIVIATDNIQNRQKYEDFAVRTFYVKNAALDEVRSVLQAVLPNTKTVVPAKQLNALVVRDTPANLDLVESVIDSLDKSKSEVLIDINLYEVSRTDLLQIGNQFFSPTSQDQERFGLSFLGGLGQQSTVLGKGPRTLTGPLAFALGLPSSAVSFFQAKGKAKLLASTQIHALDNESHKVNIGQRVPIQTAALPSGFIQQQPNRPNQNPQQNIDQFFGGNFGIPQIQYENVGLNIDMQPTVFEDEVQIKMSLETSSVDLASGKLTPTFNQRKMSSVARIRDGQTTMIAGVSQTEQAKSIRGIPLIGLIPILGRFFSTPETTDRQSDVVITVTPHILRRADIREEDHLAKNAGSGTSSSRKVSIVEILHWADREDSQQPAVAANGQPDRLVASQTGPTATSSSGSQSSTPGVVNVTNTGAGVVVTPPPTAGSTGPPPQVQRKPVSAPGVRSSQVDDEEDDEGETSQDEDTASPAGTLTVAVAGPAVIGKGQQFIAAIRATGSVIVSSVNLSMSYDPNIFEVKAVRSSGIMNAGGANADPQFTAQGGIISVQLERPPGTGGVPLRGHLLYIIFEVKGQGQTTLALSEGSVFRMPNGQAVPAKYESLQVEVK